MKRAGKFTIADLAGTAVLVTLLAVFWIPMTDAIGESWAGANLLVKASLAIILPGLLFAILGRTLVATEPTPRQPRPPERRDPRRRRQR